MNTEIQRVLDDLTSTDPLTKTEARKAIRESTDNRYVDGLIDLLVFDTRPYIRQECITLLGYIGHKDATLALLNLLASTNLDELIEEDLITALGRIGDSRSEDAILARADHPSIYIRKKVARALGSFESESCLTALEILLDDEEHEVRSNAVQALGQIKNPRTITILDEALDDRAWTVREQAVKALACFDDTAIIEPMIYALSDIRSSIRVVAANKLGELRTPLAYEPLLQARHPFRQDANKAIDEALDKLDDKYIRDADMDISLLIELLPVHHKPDVIAQTLEMIGTPQAIDAVDAWRNR